MVKPKNKGRHRITIGILLAGTLLLFAVADALTFLFIPATPPRKEPTQRVLEIPQGATLRGTALLLYENGVISGVEPFVILSKLFAVERRIIPGEYSFSSHMVPFEIIRLIESGRVIRYGVTIPEGYNMEQVAQLIEKNSLAKAEDTIRRARDSEFVRALGFDGDSLEGYLFPDSYYFSKNIGIDGILKAMTRRFDEAYTPDMAARAAEIGMSRREVVTLASIIEKEAGVQAERARISAVFHNRIKRRIPLQSDPTVIYALPNFNGNLTRRNLSFPSPYNTYRVRGLPPGPIANPGSASLMAALYPAQVDDLYFVSKNNGTHHFSKTLEEHNRAVNKYQRQRS